MVSTASDLPVLRIIHRTTAIAVAALVLAACGGSGEDVVATTPGQPGQSEAPALPSRAVDTLSRIFSVRYDVAESAVAVVPVEDPDAAASVIGPDLVEGHDEVWIAYAGGDFVDRYAHPPLGYEAPIGRTAYVVLSASGEFLGGGLLLADASRALDDLGEERPLSAHRRST